MEQINAPFTPEQVDAEQEAGTGATPKLSLKIIELTNEGGSLLDSIARRLVSDGRIGETVYDLENLRLDTALANAPNP